MEEIEVPTEHLHEHMHHEAHESHDRWIALVALASAITAVLAAIAALLAGGHANEAMIEQIRSSDKWAYYQAKGIKASLLASKMELLSEMGREKPTAKDEEKLVEYKKQQDDIQKEAQELEQASRAHFLRHEIFARGVTLFQVAIALAAIAVLTRRRRFFYLSLGFVLIGGVFLVQGLISKLAA
jgi:hypothetical protein